jgi:hypothetical protein
MTLTMRYLNFQSGSDILTRIGVNTSLQSNLDSYNECFLNYSSNPNKINEFIKSQIINYVDKNYSLINIVDADINYYIERINLFLENKFKDIIEEINVIHIISMCDYFSNKNKSTDNSNITNHYIYWRNEYYKIVEDIILCGKYKIFGLNDKETLITLLEKNWNNIKFDNLIKFANTLNKIKFLGQDVSKYIVLISNKFDEIENLTKLLVYIEKKLEYINPDTKAYTEKETQVEFDYEKERKTSNSKYNYRFVLDCLKSNCYLLFEEFNFNIKNKYKKQQQIETIITDKRIINYFLYIVSQKDSNTTNRKVNELLISIKNYIEDIEESYYNNISYKKITVKQESDKYKSVDLNSYNRENSTFTIFKYSNINQSNINGFTLSPQIEPYFDIYKNYYKSRYPDREVEFDPIKSTMIVKIVFNSKQYYIHMALIQYIVMDKLFKVKENDGLGIKEISSQTNIDVKNLQQTINSLLHIKLIKHSSNTSNIADMKFYINYDFMHQTNKISICSLIIPKEQKVLEERELIHDRNTIILSNLYDYIKKNKTFSIDNIYDEISKNKLPFKIELEQIISAIKVMVEKEDIIEIIGVNQSNIKTYKYCQ